MNAIAHLRPENAPFSVEAEQQLLGAFLLMSHAPVGEAFARAMRNGGADLFYDPVHRRIFEVMAGKYKAGELISPVTVGDVLRADLADLGGPAYLARIAGASMPHSADGYVSLLADLRWKRQLVAVMSEAQAAIAGGEDAATIAGRIEAGLIASHGEAKSGPVSMAKAVATALHQIAAAYRGDDSDVVKSGLPSLDEIVPGFYPGELILLGGRPSMGKTAVALGIALNAARKGHGVCIASLEMNPEAMAMRALSEATANAGRSVHYSTMRRGDIMDGDIDVIQRVSGDVGNLPITFLSRDYSDLGALFAGVKQAQRAGNLGLLVVDYAQLLKSKAPNRYEQITEISIALKQLAGQLNIPVIALSQLSRAVEQRDDKRPQLSDLRESGQLEQDADTVLFCYRDEYYLERERADADTPDAFAKWDAAMQAAKNRLEIIVAKQRQGQIGTATMGFNPASNVLWELGR